MQRSEIPMGKNQAYGLYADSGQSSTAWLVLEEYRAVGRAEGARYADPGCSVTAGRDLARRIGARHRRLIVFRRVLWRFGIRSRAFQAPAGRGIIRPARLASGPRRLGYATLLFGARLKPRAGPAASRRGARIADVSGSLAFEGQIIGKAFSTVLEIMHDIHRTVAQILVIRNTHCKPCT